MEEKITTLEQAQERFATIAERVRDIRRARTEVQQQLDASLRHVEIPGGVPSPKELRVVIGDLRQAHADLRGELATLIQRAGDIAAPKDAEECKRLVIFLMQFAGDILAGEQL